MTDSNDEGGRDRPDHRRGHGGRPAPRAGAKRDGERPRRDRDDRSPRSSREDRPPAPGRAEVAPEAPEPAEERIAKVIARAGIASRRDAEAMIAEGRVTLNGEAVASPALNVPPDAAIAVDGEPLPARERTRLWLFHKPRGLVTTARDPEGRATVFEHLPPDLPRVVAVGRLDINTEGLLLLTNDGGLAKVIAHPDTGWLRRYRIRAHGDIAQAELDRLRDGITVDGMEYGPVEAVLDRVQGDNLWITLGLREGKNREVKRILEHLGLQVNRLIRLSFGPFQLGDLEPGLAEEVRTKVLREQLGPTLAAEAGVDFESKVREPIAPFGSPKAREPSTRDEAPRPDRKPAPRRDDHREGRPRDDRRPRSDEPSRPPRGAPRRSVWRDEESAPRTGTKAPRRGADPRAARAAAAERPRERVGSFSAGEGREVVVERLVGAPEAEGGGRRADERTPRRPAPRGDDRPRRPREERDGRERGFGETERRGPPRRDGPAGSGSGRAGRDRDDRGDRGGDGPRARSFGDRPGRDERGGDGRPFKGPRSGPPRGRDADRPGSARADRPPRGGSERGDTKRGERPRGGGPPRGDGPPHGGRFSKGPSRGGGFSKGPPRGRR